MVEQYLADEHEVDEAADFYMARFAKEGSTIEQPIELVVRFRVFRQQSSLELSKQFVRDIRARGLSTDKEAFFEKRRYEHSCFRCRLSGPICFRQQHRYIG